MSNIVIDSVIGPDGITPARIQVRICCIWSYHDDYGEKTYKEIKDLAAANPPDKNKKAHQMKKRIEQAERLQKKGKGRQS